MTEKKNNLLLVIIFIVLISDSNSVNGVGSVLDRLVSTQTDGVNIFKEYFSDLLFEILQRSFPGSGGKGANPEPEPHPEPITSTTISEITTTEI